MFAELAFDPQFKSAAQGAAGVLIGGASAGIAQNHQLIFGGDLEHGRVDSGVIDLSLQAHFVLGAFGRLEAEVKAIAAWGISQLGLGRRFKPFARADITMQIRGEGIHHADRWRGFLIALGTAVVAIAQKLIIDVHFHGAVAQAGLHGPVIDSPVGLYIRIQAAGGIDLVAYQCAFDPQLIA